MRNLICGVLSFSIAIFFMVVLSGDDSYEWHIPKAVSIACLMGCLFLSVIMFCSSAEE